MRKKKSTEEPTTSLVCLGMHDLYHPHEFAKSSGHIELNPRKIQCAVWNGGVPVDALEPLLNPKVSMSFLFGLPNIVIKGLSDNQHEALCKEVMPDEPSRSPSLAAQWLIVLVMDHLRHSTSDDIADVDTSMLRFVSTGRSKERRVLNEIEVSFYVPDRALRDCNRLACVALEAVRRTLASNCLFVWYGRKDSVFDLSEFKSPSIQSKYVEWLTTSGMFRRESTGTFRYMSETSQFLVMSYCKGAAADGHVALTQFLASVDTYTREATIPAPVTNRSEVLWLEEIDARTIDVLSVDGVRIIDASYVSLDADIRAALVRLLERAGETGTLRAVSLCGTENLDMGLVKVASSALSPPCVAVSVWRSFYLTMPEYVPHVLPGIPPRSVRDSPCWIRSKADLQRLCWNMIEAQAFLAQGTWLK
uniref:Uncharacterized protein n=1 Tax=Sexangularia sp. CB-2014 TaxID=1486929 RepID=A0A7S1V230_9EUKA|mmetsp:Transcript_10204/g.32356  ORF Transcript_10204/g.32356 Transcript_10204/m.32356 type:complete len:419 (+) Transcript_10204:220-1476(+)